MQNLIATNVLTMSSREIAQLTNKEHKNVKRDIEKMLSELKEDALTFERIYTDSMNRKQSEYLLDKDHTECLLSGYSAELRMRVIKRWHELEKVINNQIKQDNTGLPQFRKARAIRLQVDTADIIFNRLPNLSEQSRQAVLANLINPIAGANVIPLPVLDQKLYSAEEVGNILGITANKVGRIANEIKLKTAEFGISVLDKAKYSDKQVETFRYNQKAVETIKSYLNKVAV